MESQAFSCCKNMKIGVTDSGIGGLTVVQELMRQLPQESIVYFGDNRNCPYGNKDPQTLISLASGMFQTLNEHTPLKLGAAACNTTSTLLEQFSAKLNFPLVSIIQPAARHIASERIASVGIFSTIFTANSGCYPHYIHALNPNCKVYSQGSPHLAALIDSGRLDSPQILEEIHTCLDSIVSLPELEHIVLACTHYPILQDIFSREYPDITFINPAKEQVKTIKEYLTQEDLLSQDPSPTFEIFTTGSPELYISMCDRLGLRQPDHIYQL